MMPEAALARLNKLANTSLVVGWLSVCAFFLSSYLDDYLTHGETGLVLLSGYSVTAICSFISIVAAIVYLWRTRQQHADGQGAAWAGLALGMVVLLAIALIFIFWNAFDHLIM